MYNECQYYMDKTFAILDNTVFMGTFTWGEEEWGSGL